MLPAELRERLVERIACAEDPREQAVDVMFEMQSHYGYMTDEAMEEASRLLGMSPLELEELATFYDHIYRSPVGRYVIHICDSLMCWMEDGMSLADHLASRLDVKMGGASADGLFTLLPVCCIGYCDRAPAMMINRRIYGKLTREKIDRILENLRERSEHSETE